MRIPNYVVIVPGGRRLALTWHNPWCRDWQCEVMGGRAWEYKFGWLYVAVAGFELSLRVRNEQ